MSQFGKMKKPHTIEKKILNNVSPLYGIVLELKASTIDLLFKSNLNNEFCPKKQHTLDLDLSWKNLKKRTGVSIGKKD